MPLRCWSSIRLPPIPADGGDAALLQALSDNGIEGIFLRLTFIPQVRIPTGRYPALDTLSAHCEARPEFEATYPAEYGVPRTA